MTHFQTVQTSGRALVWLRAASGCFGGWAGRIDRRLHFVRRLLLISTGLVVFATASAQEPDEAVEDPLSEEEVSVGKTGARIWQKRSADQALRMGFSSLAARGYRELLEDNPDRDALRLDLASALISEGQFGEAREVLNFFDGREDAAYLLRRAVLDWQDRRWARVEASLDAFDPDDLPAVERGWYYFLRGLAADQADDEEEAKEAYATALKESVSQSQRAHFLLGQYQTNLFAGEASEELAEELKKQMESFEGQTTGYRFAQQYAVVLDLLGQKEEATQVIRDQIRSVPAAERELRDQFLLLDGLISGSESGQGRESLRELLETGGRRRLQRIALQKLAGNVTGENSDFFGDLLTRLIDAEHSLVEELRLFRSQLALRQARNEPAGERRTRRFAAAMEDAQHILTQYPGSRFKQEALEILAASAWEERRYRTAANHLMELRDELSAGERRGEVGLLVADCYFRSGEVNRTAEDYRNAADAYGTVLRERPGSVSPGLLLYQRVLSEIRGGRTAEATRHLKEIPEEMEIEPEYRWQAEWNLVKAMQRAGEMEAAYSRVNAMLDAEEAEDLAAADLRLRLEWLQAQLSFEAGKPEETLPLVARVIERVEDEAAEVEAGLKERIAGYSFLLQGQAQFAVGDTAEAIATLEGIRERFPGTDPALYSFLVEARHYTQVNRTVDAQQLLISLADSHKESRYAPIALYEAALNAQRRGQEASYQNQASELLGRLVNDYPDHALAFYARLRQGDLLRQLNRFEAAERVYLWIENNFPNHADIALVQLSLADCYLARAESEEASGFRNAVSILERLFDLPDLPADLRAEAGFKLAFANATRDGEERAQEIYWATVSRLYLDKKEAETLGARGRYWVSRCLFEYGDQFQREGRLENARNAYSIIVSNRLPGESLARANLQRLMSNGE